MVTTKKRAIEHTQKEMRKDSKYREDSNAGNEKQKEHRAYRKQVAQ